ncbi:MAG: amidohydrolase family protein [Pseudomonadota bacterium]|jgi:imidazolonepropionase-like amidohydrolase
MGIRNGRILRSVLGLAAALGAASALHAQNTVIRPGVAPDGPVVIVAGFVHPVSGPPIPSGRVRFEAGRITAVGADAPTEGATVIDAAGKHVYPGLIAGSSVLGLVEVQAVRATNDTAEVGVINPNARAEIAYNPDTEVVPVTRANGVLAALVHPVAGQQGVITGTASVMQLDGWTWEDATVRRGVGVHVEWPGLLVPEFLPPPLVDATRKAQSEKRASLETAIAEAKAYRTAKDAGAVALPDLRWEAMLPVLRKERPLLVTANDLESIEDALDFVARHDLRMVLLGGLEAWRIAALLKAREVPVIVGGTHVLPLRRSDPVDAAFANPARLHAAGIAFAISGPGDSFSVANERNLPYHAATAVAHGLAADEALKAITLYPAQILGVADRLGSLEAGKDATLFISDGDPLENGTTIEQAWIAGRPVDLRSRHTLLDEKYRAKYGQPAR